MALNNCEIIFDPNYFVKIVFNVSMFQFNLIEETREKNMHGGGKEESWE